MKRWAQYGVLPGRSSPRKQLRGKAGDRRAAARCLLHCGAVLLSCESGSDSADDAGHLLVVSSEVQAPGRPRNARCDDRVRVSGYLTRNVFFAGTAGRLPTVSIAITVSV